jgi:NAD(P)H-hydrate epimerase
VHTAEQVRAMDRYAIEQLRIPAYTLMTRAGAAALRVLHECWPEARRVLILCGPGNNGGDGYVLARLARAQGVQVRVVALSDPAQLKGEALQAWRDFAAVGGAQHPWDLQDLAQTEVVVDAIFGTGLSRPLSEEFAAPIRQLNASGLPVFSLDIPSGLHSDDGRVLGCAVHAKCTLSFVGLKLGYYLGEGPDQLGRLHFDSLGVPEHPAIATAARRIDNTAITQLLPPRHRSAHKGNHGHVLVIGGGPGMGGAVRLAGEAALRVGAGLVTVATYAANVAAINAARPELMCHGVDNAEALARLMMRADVIAIGPGLGTDAWARALFEKALTSECPLVVDADALNLLAQRPTRRNDWILTPHPGEASRLLGTSTQEVQSDRLRAARSLTDRYGGTVVLKGANSVVLESGELPWLCDRGNPGMGTAGMGDVLTGVVAGIAAQVADAGPAARVGVLVHALAGDLAAASIGQRGLLASDVLARLPTCVNASCA